MRVYAGVSVCMKIRTRRGIYDNVMLYGWKKRPGKEKEERTGKRRILNIEHNVTEKE